MDFFIAGRRNGKTTLLIDWFAQDPDNSVIICLDARRKDYIMRRLFERWPDINPRHWNHNVLIAPGAVDHMRGYRHSRVGIDDLNDLLSYWFGNVEFVTATGTKVQPDA